MPEKPDIRVTYISSTQTRWDYLKEGAKLHLTLPFWHAYNGIKSNSRLVKHERYEDNGRDAILFSDNKTGGRNWFSNKTYEFEFKKLYEETIEFEFLVAADVGSPQVNATMDIREDNRAFRSFGNSDSHSVDFTGGCDSARKQALRKDYQMVDKGGSHNGHFVTPELSSPIKEGNSSLITINNSQEIEGLVIRDDAHDILVYVWKTASVNYVRWGKNKRATSVGDHKIGEHHYHKYRIRPLSDIEEGRLNLRIGVTPQRDGRYNIRLRKVDDGENHGSTDMAIFNVKVSSRFSCLYD